MHRVSFIMILLLTPLCMYSASQTPHRAYQEPLMLKLDDCGVSILVEKENDAFRLPSFHTLIQKTNVTEDSLHVGNMPGRKIILSSKEKSDLSHAPDCQWIHTNQFMRKRDDTILSVKSPDNTFIPLDDDFARIIIIYKSSITEAIKTIAPQLACKQTAPSIQSQSISYHHPVHQHVGILCFSKDTKNNVRLLLTKVGRKQRFGISTEIYDPATKDFDTVLKTLTYRTRRRFADHSPNAQHIIASHITEKSNQGLWEMRYSSKEHDIIFQILPMYIPRLLALQKKNAWVPLKNNFPLEGKTIGFLERYGDMLHALPNYQKSGK